jgi:uncharacterized protein YqeY
MPSVEARLQDDLGAVTRAGDKVCLGRIRPLGTQLRCATSHAAEQRSHGAALNAVAAVVKTPREAIERHEKGNRERLEAL